MTRYLSGRTVAIIPVLLLVSLLPIPSNLDFGAALINFGALIAFSFVNLTVIAYFAVRKGERHTPKQIFVNIVLPLIGVAMTVVLWVNLSSASRIYGLIWFGIGIVVLLWITRLLRRPLTMTME